MFDKLLEIVLAAKSGALSGVLIVAGAVVTVTAGGGAMPLHLLDEPSPTPSIAAPADPDPEPVAVVEEPAAEPEEREAVAIDEPSTSEPELTCQNAEGARTEARERVASAFVEHRNALDEVRAQHRSARAVETLKQAETMLREIADKTDLILADMSECDKSQVADRAIAAMETVVNLAKSGAAVTPAPKPTQKPKATPKPTVKPKVTAKPKATPKPARTPSCDDRIYANKLKMVAAFEKYHTIHDKLYAAIKRSGSQTTVGIVLANDKLMHTTYDHAKQEILSSGCAGDAGAVAAARAAATFERAYLSSAAAIASDRR